MVGACAWRKAAVFDLFIVSSLLCKHHRRGSFMKSNDIFFGFLPAPRFSTTAQDFIRPDRLPGLYTLLVFVIVFFVVEHYF